MTRKLTGANPTSSPIRSCFVLKTVLFCRFSLFLWRAKREKTTMATEKCRRQSAIWINFNHQPWVANRTMCQQYWYDIILNRLFGYGMQSILKKKKFGYMQFLMNKTSKELIDLFTKCIAFCINLLLQSCFKESDAGERTLVLSCSTLHRDTFVSMFWCFYYRLRGAWQAKRFVDMIFLSKGWRLRWTYRVKRPHLSLYIALVL